MSKKTQSDWTLFLGPLWVYNLSLFLTQADLVACLTVCKSWSSNALLALEERKGLNLAYTKLLLLLQSGKQVGKKHEQLSVFFNTSPPMSTPGVDLRAFAALKNLTVLLPKAYPQIPELYSAKYVSALNAIKNGRKILETLDLYVLSSQDYFFLMYEKNLLQHLCVKELNLFCFIDRVHPWQWADLEDTMRVMLEKKFSPALEKVNWVVCVLEPYMRSSDPFSQRRGCQMLQTCLKRAELKAQAPQSGFAEMNLFASPDVFQNLPTWKGTLLSELQTDGYTKFKCHPKAPKSVFLEVKPRAPERTREIRKKRSDPRRQSQGGHRKRQRVCKK